MALNHRSQVSRKVLEDLLRDRNLYSEDTGSEKVFNPQLMENLYEKVSIFCSLSLIVHTRSSRPGHVTAFGAGRRNSSTVSA